MNRSIFRKILISILTISFLMGFLGFFLGTFLESIKNKTNFFSICIFLFLFLLALSFYLSRRISKPIGRLKEDARIIGAGNFDYKIQIRSGDEFEDLAEAFNKMAQDLKKYYAILEESKDVLEIRVRARTKEIVEMAAGLEEKVDERTKGLMESREALMNMLEDVEDARKKIEEEKDKTESIVANFTDGLLVFNQEGGISFINPEAEKFLRLRRKEVLGKKIKDVSRDPFLNPLFEIIEMGVIKDIFRKELKVSSDLVLEVTSVPLMSDNEKKGCIVIIHNITREKLVEIMKTEFVSLAAHQLRTPLSAIKWTLKLILDKDLGKLNKEQEDFLNDAYESNERMISLINDLLNITRIEEGKYLYKIASVDFLETIQSMIDSYKKLAKEKGVKFEFKKPTQKISLIPLDEEKIKMAADNLLANALRYTPTGGTITAALEFNEKGLKFSVSDTGVGIPEEQKKRVFSKFFRGTNVIKMETEGTGLGLFITKNIIEAHDGKIGFESKENQGTTFYFTLPFKDRID